MNNFQNDIISDYKNYHTIKFISDKYNISPYNIHKILNNNQIGRISILKRHNPNIIENYFKNINSPNKMYWIGFLLTDGCVCNKHHCLSLGLKECDKYILELFENDLCVSNHVKTYKHANNRLYSEFTIKCKQYCEDLKKYGIVENKTLDLKFPYNIINFKYDSSLIRGLFDGDGGFTLGSATRYIRERKKSYTNLYSEFSFTGTYDMCDGFQNTILSHIDLSRKKINRNNSMFHVRWSNRNEIIKICEFMYENKNDHYLKRKFDKYIRLLNKEY